MFEVQGFQLLLNGMMWGAGLSLVVAAFYIAVSIREKKKVNG